MPHDPANPWLFRRDELDMLEDEIDGVFDLHEQSRDPVNRTMEETVIGEQTKTEDSYERRLSDVLGPDALLEDEPHVCEHCKDGFPEGVALKDLLSKKRDPLYVRSYLWATKVFVWARESYWKQGMRNRDMFRVNVNACLVPVKIAFALAEEGHGDAHAPSIAGLEYDLALVYLARTRESLGALRTMGLAYADLVWMIEEADALAAEIKDRRSRFPSL
ncbi:hypothetical protein A2348_03755 [Candidatus Uhrbacteria bacterium RIFOXYB12_FULL_58_10]|uniref:Uncharacterized protein n=1 Tax=Candidatus Uhrbacteria bacterium RIFOXYB2_FULL_57_15 TaxID=1802422 RepID=A0A1F7W9Z9_9BACT|nr:MAG: hypothetical protein A2348_03755 [Candidatus Uhrbacteria bacterium RIFOXYB12_FULL_58_10]OGL99416.1 MAG: hypothetical protein A2304_01330 [Candidatus Uhrbacteria bacterium RIFOXYB2_FULL_57_15]OGL99859.1 MAG: hypothetical protein A2501_05535 [Candidatus Uhrbacteria bacterium RIFOXYC12_FULL_57_11]